MLYIACHVAFEALLGCFSKRNRELCVRLFGRLSALSFRFGSGPLYCWLSLSLSPSSSLHERYFFPRKWLRGKGVLFTFFSSYFRFPLSGISSHNTYTLYISCSDLWIPGLVAGLVLLFFGDNHFFPEVMGIASVLLHEWNGPERWLLYAVGIYWSG